MKLIIFDLDQTIIDLFPIHNETTTQVFEQIFNKKARMDEIEFVGKTLEACIEELAELKKIPKQETKKNIIKAIKLYEKIFIRNIPSKIKSNILLGASNLIKKLYKKDNIIALVTGDSKIIAKTILKKAELLKYFTFLVTGEKETKRIKLIREALRKVKIIARKKKEKINKIFVIGDSIRDVKSGKEIGATTIAVLTGFHSREQLKRAGADYIFKNLVNKKIAQIIEK